MKVTAVICVRNGAAYITRCLEHLAAQGVDVALIDHSSDDATLSIANAFRTCPVIHLSRLEWQGHFDLGRQLAAKAEVMASLTSDWWIHQDIDEVLTSDRLVEALPDALARVEADGYNAIDFDEFVFVPQDETSRHEATDYVAGMHYYYYFRPRPGPRLMRAWRSSSELSWAPDGAGHHLAGPVRLYPSTFTLRHYMHLSYEHVLAKYPTRRYSPSDLAKGWHRRRAALHDAILRLPPRDSLKRCDGQTSVQLDRSSPRSTHFWEWP
jgi:hypothetical protein